MRVIETTIYKFSELSPAAKERARDWYRGCIDAEDLTDPEDWSTIAGILGVTFDQWCVPLMGGGVRYDDCVYWSLYPSWCAFAGRYAYAKGAPKAIRAHASRDVELHRIADSLQALQRRHFYRLTANCEERREHMVVACDDGFYGERGADELTELLRDFAAWIVRQIEGQDEYLMSDESVDESILANEYEFDADGNRA